MPPRLLTTHTYVLSQGLCMSKQHGMRLQPLIKSHLEGSITNMYWNEYHPIKHVSVGNKV